MPPPTTDRSLDLLLVTETYSVLQLKPDEELPVDLLNLLIGKTSDEGTRSAEKFVSITRTADELSVVYDKRLSANTDVPQWRCIKIRGPMDFGLTGIMCDFATPLKHAGIPLFALSTWNTDYILIPSERINEAVDALKADGWKFDA